MDSKRNASMAGPEIEDIKIRPLMRNWVLEAPKQFSYRQAERTPIVEGQDYSTTVVHCTLSTSERFPSVQTLYKLGDVMTVITPPTSATAPLTHFHVMETREMCGRYFTHKRTNYTVAWLTEQEAGFINCPLAQLGTNCSQSD